jgi:hypothetical protein
MGYPSWDALISAGCLPGAVKSARRIPERVGEYCEPVVGLSLKQTLQCRVRGDYEVIPAVQSATL